MTVFDALVLRSAHQTVIIARTVVPARAAHMRQAGGAELRGALDDHLATNIASASDLSAFLLASGGQPISILRTAELVAAVVAAAESGRLHAYLFREPGYVSNADLQALRTKAELAVRRSLAVRPGSPPARPFAELDASDRFIEVLRRTVPRVGPQMAHQLREIIEDPAQLTLMVATIVVLAQLHAVAAGEVIDGVVLTAIVACAVVEGMGIVQAMVAALEAVANLVDFIITTVGARDYADLDRAAEKLAAGLGAIGVGILCAALARIAGRFRDSLKKAGGQRRIETVTKEEMAGKGRQERKEPEQPPQVHVTPKNSPSQKPTTADLIAGQPHKTLDELYQVAPKHQKTLAESCEQISSKIGARFENPGIKERSTAEEKMTRKRYADTSRMTDVIRGGVVVENPRQADEFTKDLSKKFTIVDEGWNKTPSGYVDRKILVKFDDGTVGEVQIWEKNMFSAKKEATNLYTERRSLPEGHPDREILEQKELAIYSEALKKAPPEWSAIGSSSGIGGRSP